MTSPSTVPGPQRPTPPPGPDLPDTYHQILDLTSRPSPIGTSPRRTKLPETRSSTRLGPPEATPSDPDLRRPSCVPRSGSPEPRVPTPTLTVPGTYHPLLPPQNTSTHPHLLYRAGDFPPQDLKSSVSNPQCLTPPLLTPAPQSPLSPLQRGRTLRPHCVNSHHPRVPRGPHLSPSRHPSPLPGPLPPQDLSGTHVPASPVVIPRVPLSPPSVPTSRTPTSPGLLGAHIPTSPHRTPQYPGSLSPNPRTLTSSSIPMCRVPTSQCPQGPHHPPPRPGPVPPLGPYVRSTPGPYLPGPHIRPQGRPPPPRVPRPPSPQTPGPHVPPHSRSLPRRTPTFLPPRIPRPPPTSRDSYPISPKTPRPTHPKLLPPRVPEVHVRLNLPGSLPPMASRPTHPGPCLLSSPGSPCPGP